MTKKKICKKVSEYCSFTKCLALIEFLYCFVSWQKHLQQETAHRPCRLLGEHASDVIISTCKQKVKEVHLRGSVLFAITHCQQLLSQTRGRKRICFKDVLL